jgi:hypothetical protein
MLRQKTAITALVIVWLAGVVPVLAGGGDILQRLDGTWEGPGLTIRIDSARLQARTDPDRPFSWSALTIENVTGEMVVFKVGEQSFIGLFSGNDLIVTSPQFAGSFALIKRD